MRVKHGRVGCRESGVGIELANGRWCSPFMAGMFKNPAKVPSLAALLGLGRVAAVNQSPAEAVPPVEVAEVKPVRRSVFGRVFGQK